MRRITNVIHCDAQPDTDRSSDRVSDPLPVFRTRETDWTGAFVRTEEYDHAANSSLEIVWKAMGIYRQMFAVATRYGEHVQRVDRSHEGRSPPENVGNVSLIDMYVHRVTVRIDAYTTHTLLWRRHRDRYALLHCY